MKRILFTVFLTFIAYTCICIFNYTDMHRAIEISDRTDESIERVLLGYGYIPEWHRDITILDTYYAPIRFKLYEFNPNKEL